MKLSSKATTLFALSCFATRSEAFSTAPLRATGISRAPGWVPTSHFSRKVLLKASSDTKPSEQETGNDDDIQRLQAMAAKYRSEAAELEAQRANERAKAAERAFQKFDLNNDGEVSLDELKAALEKTFKMDLPEQRVKKLMEDFDKSGDGKLQKEEFVGMEQFRNKLESLAQEEKKKALEAQKAAQKESETSKFLEAQREMINDNPPTATDKIVSTLPYLFPLMDGLLFGQYLLGNSENPIAIGLAGLYMAYRSIPFAGFLSFLSLSVLSGNLSINRLVRFNMQQAIFLDIALFVPGLVGAVTNAASSGLGFQIPPGVGELSSNAIFIALIASVGYSTISSLLGVTPDKVPFISNAVNNRLPSIDMFEPGGRFDPKRFDEKDGKKKDEDNHNDKND